MTVVVARSAAWSAGLRPAPMLTVSEWADLYRVLPQKSSAEPGPWRTARTPYLREIMDCFSTSSPIDEVVLMKGGQIGGSEAGNNVVGYAIDYAPGPCLIVQPTVEAAKKFSRQRIDPLIAASPSLARKVAVVRSRDASNTMLVKEFDGGILVITGANSSVGLRSMPVRWLFLDEIDVYPADVDNEGAPVELAEVRTRTFARRKVFKVSTPKVADASPIESAYQKTDQRRYFVPCPTCQHMQWLEFGRLKWRAVGRPADEAAYECNGCGTLIAEHHKSRMLAEGEWRPTATSSRPGLRGYHLSALYSPVGWLSWAEIARKHDLARNNPSELRVFKNSILGETWREATLAADWEALYRRRAGYRIGTCPDGVCFLTCGVDVGKDYLLYEVVGWGRGKTSWSIEWGTLLGDTSDAVGGPWGQLDALLNRSFPTAWGSTLSIARLCIDTGFNTTQVHRWAKRYPVSRVRAVRGHAGIGPVLGTPRAYEYTRHGVPLKRGYKAWPVYGHVVKDELFGFLGLEAPLDGGTPPEGYCHFPEYEPDYFKQLTAEHLVPVKGRGHIYEQIAGRANHVLDARQYARAAGEPWLSQWTAADWARLERELRPAVPVFDDEVAPDGAEVVR